MTSGRRFIAMRNAEAIFAILKAHGPCTARKVSDLLLLERGIEIHPQGVAGLFTARKVPFRECRNVCHYPTAAPKTITQWQYFLPPGWRSE